MGRIDKQRAGRCTVQSAERDGYTLTGIHNFLHIGLKSTMSADSPCDQLFMDFFFPVYYPFAPA